MVLQAIPALERSAATISAARMSRPSLKPSRAGNLITPAICPTPPSRTCPADHRKTYILHAADAIEYYYDYLTATNAVNPITNTAWTVNHPETVQIYNHAKCDQNTLGLPPTGAGYSDVVALYAVETGGGASLQCQQL